MADNNMIPIQKPVRRLLRRAETARFALVEWRFWWRSFTKLAAAFSIISFIAKTFNIGLIGILKKLVTYYRMSTYPLFDLVSYCIGVSIPFWYRDLFLLSLILSSVSSRLDVLMTKEYLEVGDLTKADAQYNVEREERFLNWIMEDSWWRRIAKSSWTNYLASRFLTMFMISASLVGLVLPIFYVIRYFALWLIRKYFEKRIPDFKFTMSDRKNLGHALIRRGVFEIIISAVRLRVDEDYNYLIRYARLCAFLVIFVVVFFIINSALWV